MRFDVLVALILFCFVSSVTPGPNNLMLMTSGVNFGVRRTLPHLMGVILGFALMVALIGLGLDALFRLVPQLLPIMRYAGAAYMLWLAWKIANSGPAHELAGRARPLGFLGAAAFQWVNPKAWVIAISALSTYAISPNYLVSVAAVSLSYLVVCLPGAGVWVLFGSAMRKALRDPLRVRLFNLAMAALLAASIVTVLTD